MSTSKNGSVTNIHEKNTLRARDSSIQKCTTAEFDEETNNAICMNLENLPLANIKLSIDRLDYRRIISVGTLKTELRKGS